MALSYVGQDGVASIHEVEEHISVTELPNVDLPDSTKLNGLCTRCAKPSTCVLEHEYIIGFREYTIDGVTPSPGEKVVVLVCDQCQGKMATIEKFGRKQYPEQPLIETNFSDEEARTVPKLQNATVSWWGVQWWPRPD